MYLKVREALTITKQTMLLVTATNMMKIIKGKS